MNRQCGSCTLCCRLIPVEELGKHAGERCKHQRTGKGCAIYAKRPWSCREWNCMWLVGDEGGKPLDLRRPDRVGYVIDTVPDMVQVRDNATGKIVNQFDVMQVWVDPAHRDAHRDPALRALLERNGIIALIRYSSTDGFTLFPPSQCADGQWHEEHGDTGKEDLIPAQRAARMAFWKRQAEQQKEAQSGTGSTETKVG